MTFAVAHKNTTKKNKKASFILVTPRETPLDRKVKELLKSSPWNDDLLLDVVDREIILPIPIRAYDKTGYEILERSDDKDYIMSVKVSLDKYGKKEIKRIQDGLLQTMEILSLNFSPTDNRRYIFDYSVELPGSKLPYYIRLFWEGEDAKLDLVLPQQLNKEYPKEIRMGRNGIKGKVNIRIIPPRNNPNQS